MSSRIQRAKRSFIYNNTTEEECRVAKNSTCKICDDTKNYECWSLCDKCLYWIHPECLSLDPEATSARKTFLCTDCLMSESSASSQQSLPKTPSLRSQDSTAPPMRTLNEIQNQPEAVKEHIRKLRRADDSHEVQNEDRTITPPGTPNFETPQGITDQDEDMISEDNNAILTNEPRTAKDRETIPEIIEDNQTPVDTDDENYAEISGITGWRMKRNRRQFKVTFRKSKEEQWVLEKHLDGAVSTLRSFCLKNGLADTELSYREGCGSATTNQVNKNIWASMDEILKAIKTYGRKDSIQAEALHILQDRDSLGLAQIGTHCFVVLYRASSGTALVSDGQNTYVNNRVAKKLLLAKLTKARHVRFIPFHGQKETDQCASSAASIAIELQRIYRTGETVSEIKVPHSIAERIRKVFHKESGQKLNPWRPITQMSWKLQCPKCHKTFNTKNRNIFNLHRC